MMMMTDKITNIVTITFRLPTGGSKTILQNDQRKERNLGRKKSEKREAAETVG